MAAVLTPSSHNVLGMGRTRRKKDVSTMDEEILYDARPRKKHLRRMKKRERRLLILVVCLFALPVLGLLAIDLTDSQEQFAESCGYFYLIMAVSVLLLYEYFLTVLIRKRRLLVYKDKIVLPQCTFFKSIGGKRAVIRLEDVERIYWYRPSSSANKYNLDNFDQGVTTYLGCPIGYYNIASAFDEKCARTSLITFKNRPDVFYTPVEIRREQIYEPDECREALKKTNLLEENQKMFYEKYIKMNRKRGRKQQPPPIAWTKNFT